MPFLVLLASLYSSYAYLRACKDLEFSHEENIELLKNIYVCDINMQALAVYKENLTMIAREWFGIALDQAYFDMLISSNCFLSWDIIRKAENCLQASMVCHSEEKE